MAWWEHALCLTILLIYLPLPIGAAVGALGFVFAWRKFTEGEDLVGKIKCAWAGALCIAASPLLWWLLVWLIRDYAARW
jgi:hypothetical protein